MIHKIVLDPALGIDPAAFVAAWNAIPACSDVGEAQIGAGAQKGFDMGTAEIVIMITTSLLLNVAGNALYEPIRAALAKSEPLASAAAEANALVEETTMIEVKEADGTQVTIVQRKVSL